MNIDTLPIIRSYSGGPSGPGRRARSGKPSLIVWHTNEGAEHLTGAEDLARYLAAAHPPDYPAYHVITDGDSAVRGAGDMERVNGAGGVAERALHVCTIGFARQSAVEWDDPFSRRAIELGADVTRQWSARYGIPVVRLSPAQIATGTIAGVCGHVDVAAVYASSQGHTDPGPNFPWARALQLAAGGAPTTSTPEEDEMQRCYLLEDSRIRTGGKAKRIAVGNLIQAVLCDTPADVTRFTSYRFDNAHDGDTPLELGKDGKPLRLKVDPADLTAALAR